MILAFRKKISIIKARKSVNDSKINLQHLLEKIMTKQTSNTLCTYYSPQQWSTFIENVIRKLSPLIHNADDIYQIEDELCKRIDFSLHILHNIINLFDRSLANTEACHDFAEYIAYELKSIIHQQAEIARQQRTYHIAPSHCLPYNN